MGVPVFSVEHVDYIANKKQQAWSIQYTCSYGRKGDKITDWNSGNGQGDNGNSSTANFVSGMMKTVPPLNDLFNRAGLNLPTYLNGAENPEGKSEAPKKKIAREKKH